MQALGLASVISNPLYNLPRVVATMLLGEHPPMKLATLKFRCVGVGVGARDGTSPSPHSTPSSS